MYVSEIFISIGHNYFTLRHLVIRFLGNLQSYANLPTKKKKKKEKQKNGNLACD